MALFPRCNSPVPVVGRHGVTLVGCHTCIQCRVAAQEHLCKILEVEASKHKYVELLTNTYDDKHLPYIDTSYLYPFGYAIRVPNRVIKKYNRRTKSFYFVEDKVSKSFQLTDFGTDKTVMFNNCGINCNNSSATTSNYIVRRTARCHSGDTKISSYQTKRIQSYFDDNF